MVLNNIDSYASTSPLDAGVGEISCDSDVLIVDFDHTLFLSNSTEEYLDSAFPAPACAFVLALIDWLKPWSLFPGEKKRFVYRDAIRVVLISILFPWTYFIYLLKARRLVKKYLNPAVIGIIDSQKWSKTVIASNGFHFILRPLIRQIACQFDVVIDSRIFPSKDGVRNLGKKSFIQSRLTDQELSRATFISDNKDDESVAGLVRDLKLIRWPDEKRVKAGQRAYIPFIYTHASNRGNKNHVLNVMIFQDFLIFLLVYSFYNSFAINTFLSLFFFLLSFWCIYEVGYFENDLHELKYESEHKNLDKLNYVSTLKNTPFEFFAWIWAFSFAVVACFLLEFPVCNHFECWYPVAFDVLKWGGWLLSLRILYRLYNYSEFGIRQFIFPLLQIARLGGPVLFLTTNFLGLFLITSQMASRWLGYLIYRGGGDERRVRKRIVRHVIFVILAVGAAVIQHDPRLLMTWQFSLMLLWSLLQGHASSWVKSIKLATKSVAS